MRGHACAVCRAADANPRLSETSVAAILYYGIPSTDSSIMHTTSDGNIQCITVAATGLNTAVMMYITWERKCYRADLGLAHVVQDVQSVLPLAQLCIGAEQCDIGHDVWL